MKELQFLYLSNNKLDDIPVPLPESLRVLHLQVKKTPATLTTLTNNILRFNAASLSLSLPPEQQYTEHRPRYFLQHPRHKLHTESPGGHQAWRQPCGHQSLRQCLCLLTTTTYRNSSLGQRPPIFRSLCVYVCIFWTSTLLCDHSKIIWSKKIKYFNISMSRQSISIF